MTYKALGRSMANYAAPNWSTDSSESNNGKIQRAQKEALRIITGSQKMSSIDHLHSETDMLQVEDHLNLLSALYHGSSTKGNYGDNLYQTLLNRVTTASKEQE